MAERNEEPPETPTGHQDDDQETVAPEPSIETIIKRIRARSEGSSADAQDGHDAIPSPAPFFSNSLEALTKPSPIRSGASVVSTRRLHNDALDGGLNPRKCSGNHLQGVYTQHRRLRCPKYANYA